jgi:hypothetical protein
LQRRKTLFPLFLKSTYPILFYFKKKKPTKLYNSIFQRKYSLLPFLPSFLHPQSRPKKTSFIIIASILLHHPQCTLCTLYSPFFPFLSFFRLLSVLFVLYLSQPYPNSHLVFTLLEKKTTTKTSFICPNILPSWYLLNNYELFLVY